MSAFVLGLIGAAVGASVGAGSGGLSGALLGFAAGALYAQVRGLSERLEKVERQLRESDRHSAAVSLRPEPAPPNEFADARPQTAAVPAQSSPTPHTPAPAWTPPPIEPELPRPADVIRPAQPAGPARPTPWDPNWLVAFFTTGNVVARIGIVIVFFGVAFLVRYAADRGLLPIEYRLVSVMLGAIVLLILGWYLRHRRRDYAMVLQGGATGILYLTIFAAFRLYGLLPATLTFGLMLLVVALGSTLAVLQNAPALAALGTSGGFLAPILASTGAGSHVSLFSYNVVLNAGVLGIAWFRSWRFLNVLGFAFTFGIGFAWALNRYKPELFRSTEPFLIAFFLMYVAIAVLFAHRQPPQLRGYLDGSLIFGVPAITFGMQSALVRDIPFGRAFSAVVMSGLYLVMAKAHWRRDAALRPLAEAFLALGVAFLTLAVPLAFDGHGTAATWALEGVALVWVGTRQQRVAPRLFGLFLQFGAAVAFVQTFAEPVHGLPILNNHFLSGAAITVGGLLSAYQLFTAPERRAASRFTEPLLVAWASLWWIATMAMEIARVAPADVAIATLALGVAASSVTLATLARRWHWPTPLHATAAALPLMAWTAMAAWTIQQGGPWQHLGWLAWPAAAIVSYALLRWSEAVWHAVVVRAWHAGTAWLIVFVLTWLAASVVTSLVPDTPTWSLAMWCVMPSALVLLLIRHGHRLAWPVQRFDTLYSGVVPAAPLAFALAWIVWACSQRGAATPLPYVPILNPLELAQAFGLVVAFDWLRRARRTESVQASLAPMILPVLLLIAFLALNTVVARLVHFYADVPFTLLALGESAVFQTGISVLWGMTSLSVMTLGSRQAERTWWFIGAGLLGLLIVKLFLVDLGNVGGVARIVSFLLSGVLILIIGYFSPVPPRSREAS